MTDEPMITALRETAQQLTADVHGRPDSLYVLLDTLPDERVGRHQLRRALPALAVLGTAAAVAATLVVGVQFAGRTGHPTSHTTTPATGVAAGGPFPTNAYFLASGGRADGNPQTLIVRVSDHTVVGALPDKKLAEPVLAPDGSKVFGFWGSSPTRLGYYDFSTGHSVVLDTRRGILAGPTISADGTTLAYEWDSVLGDPEHSASVVVRNLRTGATRLLRNAPAGPQVLSLSLSPDGTELAVIPTTTSHRPLLIVSTTDDKAFQHASTINAPSCGSGWTAEPRWTVNGLYALRYCDRDGFTLAGIDLKTHTVNVLHRFGSAGVLAYTPVPRASGDLFLVSDESQVPPTRPVSLYEPQDRWAATPMSGIDGLAEVTSE